MVEVFKTDVQHHDHADMLVDQIHRNFAPCEANFDLDDCDRILRVKTVRGSIKASSVIDLLDDFGFHAEVLPEDVSAVQTSVAATTMLPGTDMRAREIKI